MVQSRRFRLLARTIPLVVATALAAAACGSSSESPPAGGNQALPAAAAVTPEWQQVIDAAKKEGTVTIYSSQGTDQLNDLANRFQKAYGIKVDVLRNVDSNIEAMMGAEHTSAKPVADVVAIADCAFIASKGTDGWWVQPTGPDFGVPAYDKAKNLSPDGSFITTAAMYVIGWNTQQIPDGIKSYQDLLNPKYKGKIGVIDPAVSPAVVDYYDYLTAQTGPSYLDQLAAQQPQIFNSVLPTGQALTSGQIWAAIAVQPLVDEKNQGAPVDFLVPKPAWGAPFHDAIVKNSPHPNAAQLLADFMVSPEGQQALGYKAASVLPNIPGTTADINGVRAFDPTKLSADHVAQFRAEFNQKFH